MAESVIGALWVITPDGLIEVVASDQEHRLPAINAALSADITQPPWIVTKVFVFGQQ